MHLRHIPPGRSHGTDGEEGRRPDPGSPCRLRRRSRAGVPLCHLPWRANPGPAPLPTVKTGAGGAGWDVSGAPSARGQPAGRGGLPQGLRSSAFRQHRTGSGPPDLRNSGERLCGYPRPPRLQPRGAPRRPRPALPPAAAAVKGDTLWSERAGPGSTTAEGPAHFPEGARFTLTVNTFANAGTKAHLPGC